MLGRGHDVAVAAYRLLIGARRELPCDPCLLGTGSDAANMWLRPKDDPLIDLRT